MISDSQWSLATLLRRLISFQAIALVVVILLGITLFILDISSEAPARLASLVGAVMLITASHLWVSDLRAQVGKGMEQFMLGTLLLVAVCSIVVVALLLFKTGPVDKLVVTLIALQLVHLVFYGVHWFFFEEREMVSHKNPTAMEIAAMDLEQNPLPPKRQSS